MFSPSSPLPCRPPGNRGGQAQSWFPRCQAMTGAPFTCITFKKKVTARDTGAIATCCHLPVLRQCTRRLFICPPDQLSKTRDSEVHPCYSLQAMLALPAPQPLIASPTPACQLKGKTGLSVQALSGTRRRVGWGRHGTLLPTILQRVHQSWVDTCLCCPPPCLWLGCPRSLSP